MLEEVEIEAVTVTYSICPIQNRISDEVMTTTVVCTDDYGCGIVEVGVLEVGRSEKGHEIACFIPEPMRPIDRRIKETQGIFEPMIKPWETDFP